MIKIRRGVFETNSSSMHSLVIKKSGKVLTGEEILKDTCVWENGDYHVYDDDIEYGRSPFRILTSPTEKFLYLIASYSDNEPMRNELIEKFKEITNIKNIEFPIAYWDNDEPYYGSVDHQSIGLVTNYLNDKNIEFEDFILNDKYIIVIDGDEYGEWEKMKESGLIRVEDIEVDINPWNQQTKDPEYEEYLKEEDQSR